MCFTIARCMSLSGLLPIVKATPAYRQLLAALVAERDEASSEQADRQGIFLLPAARPAFLAALLDDLAKAFSPATTKNCPAAGPRPSSPATVAIPQNLPPSLLLVVPQAGDAKRLWEQSTLWAADPAVVLHYPDPDALPYERVPTDPATIQGRLAALARLRLRMEGSPQPLLIVASIRSLLHYTLLPEQLVVWHLKAGTRIDLASLLQSWLDLGYSPVSMVEEPGRFSRRGGILDIWPPACEYPVRLELFGDEIDSLRYFSPDTQRSLGPAGSVIITPTAEAMPRYAPLAAQALAAVDASALHPEARASWQSDLDDLRQGRLRRDLDFYMPYFYPSPASLLDHFTGFIFLDDPQALAEVAQELHAQAEDLRARLIARGQLPVQFQRPYFTWEELSPKMGKAGVRCLALMARWRPPFNGEDSEIPAMAMSLQSPPPYAGRLRQLLDDCLAWTAAGQRVILVSHQAPRLSDLLAEKGVIAPPLEQIKEPPPPGSITVVQGSAGEGWMIPPSTPAQPYALIFLTDAEIFGWVKPRRAARRARAARETLLSELRPGDYVVHVDHGIGIFAGLEKLTLDGVEREYLHLKYAEGDSLYVPVENVDRVARYTALTEEPPQLTRLSGADWEHAKARVKKAVRDVARELLALYAARELASGYAFSPDTAWQGELEASFPYLETPDQLKAIAEVKADMERQRPMDRLICGDVGYGKTEIALRAAFKAVMDGKQVAMLVPTTILAQQHFNTFSERLAAFPIRVEMLSRLRSEKEQQEVLAGLKAGTVDIVIGTHRLLQKDVTFKDLGLVIIDEEQRFGVIHKERLKQLRKEVDVLTLTATPIPRTLHMSLMGVRDMSTIETPPEERLPIITIVHEYDETLIREAILRELDRGGQAYFIHNRVQSIEAIANRLRRLVPEASFAVAHGQMPEEQLEQVMLDFTQGRYDVLVCTAIIEAGIDIPNVNTIIIDRANHFGLAQLYQLRGRVGRGANRAYAYLLYDKEFQLTETAQKRLEVIGQATELGAGFRIAMKDLEIRGAGNLLGVEQHGHIAAVGFDLYTRLLAEAIRELKEATERGQEAMEETAMAAAPAPVLELPLDAHLPADYVADVAARLALYQRMAALSTLQEVDDLRNELRDRFGPLPPQAENLVYLLELKVLAAAAGVRSVKGVDETIVLRLGEAVTVSNFARLVKLAGTALKQPSPRTLRLDRRRLGSRWKEVLRQLLRLLAQQDHLDHTP